MVGKYTLKQQESELRTHKMVPEDLERTYGNSLVVTDRSILEKESESIQRMPRQVKRRLDLEYPPRYYEYPAESLERETQERLYRTRYSELGKVSENIPVHFNRWGIIEVDIDVGQRPFALPEKFIRMNRTPRTFRNRNRYEEGYEGDTPYKQDRYESRIPQERWYDAKYDESNNVAGYYHLPPREYVDTRRHDFDDNNYYVIPKQEFEDRRKDICTSRLDDEKRGVYKHIGREYDMNLLPEYESGHFKSEFDLDKLENRRRREQLLKEQEEELRIKEKELELREKLIQDNEIMKRDKEKDDLYDLILKKKERELKLKCMELEKREKQIQMRESQLKGQMQGLAQAADTDAKADSAKNEQDNVVMERQNVNKKDEKHETANISIPTFKTESNERMERVTEGTLPNQITKSNLESSGIRNLETIEKDQGNKPKDITTAEKNTGLQDKQGFFPKFAVFSGEEPRPKNEATFEEWRYEVNCTRSDHIYPDQAIAQAIRRSLKGQAKKVLLPMGTSSTVQEIIERLEGVFGNVAAGESVMQEFYTATQKSDESVTAWGLRLEEIIQKAVDKGHVKQEETNNMLKNKFWRCLRSDRLKNATRIHYETLTSFEGLRRKVRAEEYEMKIASGVQHQPMKTEKKGDREERTVEDESVLEQLLTRITSLEKEVKQINRNRGNRFGRRNEKKDFKQTESDNEKQNTHPKSLN